MRFAHVELLSLLLLVPLLGLFAVWATGRRKRALALFADEKLLAAIRPAASDGRRRAKTAMVLAAVGLIALSVSGPQLGQTTEEVRRKGVDVVIAIDVSRSMLAEDVRPNRLERAKLAVSSLIDRLEGDRVAILAFAGEPYVFCPLTLDYGAARMFLDIMDTQVIPTQGTDVAAAIREAAKVFEPTERKHKVLILITDGENHEDDAVKAAQEAADQGVVIHTVGVGTPNGEFIPELDDQGKVTGYKKAKDGDLVRSKLDEVTLQKIALIANGRYFRASLEESELDKIYAEIAGMEKKDLKSQMIVRYKNRYQWLLLPAILLLAGEAALSERRRINGKTSNRVAK